MSKEQLKELNKYKRDCVRIARQLCYDPAIIKEIEKGNDESTVTRLMRAARLS